MNKMDDTLLILWYLYDIADTERSNVLSYPAFKKRLKNMLMKFNKGMSVFI